MNDAVSLADLSEPHVRLLEKLCDDFERAWREALRIGMNRPRLEDSLSQLPASMRTIGLRELALVELGQRRQHDEKPVPEDYVDRSAEIADIFNALLTAKQGIGVQLAGRNPFPNELRASPIKEPGNIP